MKTVIQSLIDEVHYPLSYGTVENKVIRRGLEAGDAYTAEVADTDAYRGALADCLVSLLHAVNFSEADKSVGNLTDKQRKAVLNMANGIYKELGEPLVELEEPKVFINC